MLDSCYVSRFFGSAIVVKFSHANKRLNSVIFTMWLYKHNVVCFVNFRSDVIMVNKIKIFICITIQYVVPKTFMWEYCSLFINYDQPVAWSGMCLALSHPHLWISVSCRLIGRPFAAWSLQWPGEHHDLPTFILWKRMAQVQTQHSTRLSASTCFC